MQQTVILSSLLKWKRKTMVVFVVKRYAVREAENWQYAVRKGGGMGVSPSCLARKFGLVYIRFDQLRLA